MGKTSNADADQVASRPMAFPFLCIASVALMVQASQWCIDTNKNNHWGRAEHCVDEWAFAVAAGTISTAFLLILVLMEKFAASTATNLKPFLAAFLALWWFITACVLTFKISPFNITGNGYFACWVGAIAALTWACDCCSMIQQNWTKLSGSVKTTEVGPLLICSIVELAAAAIFCDEHNSCTKEAGYAVAVGAVSTFCCLLCIAVPQANKWMSLFLIVWWIPACYVLTFTAYNGSFTHTGNGYFATWGALIFAAAFFLSIWAPGTDLGLPTIHQPQSTGP